MIPNTTPSPLSLGDGERLLAAEIRDVIVRFEAKRLGRRVPRQSSGKFDFRKAMTEERHGDGRTFRRPDIEPEALRLYRVVLVALASAIIERGRA